MKKIPLFLIYLVAAMLGFWFGFYKTMPTRDVQTDRMESCLKFYAKYRQTSDQKELSQSLSEISLTPKDFQLIIDRFIYYRSRKSGLDQAMKLLNAFRNGYKIEVEKVDIVSGMDNEPFRLDAEILAIFEKKPKLIDEAFNS